MKQTNHRLLLAAVLTAGLVTTVGCSGPIYRAIDENTPVIKDFERLRRDPDGHKGTHVILGGEVIETRNDAEGTTILVLQQPLGLGQRPKGGDQTHGRFIARFPEYLDPMLFARGRRVTIGGRVGGVQRENVGEVEYPYILIHGKEIHIWKEPEYPAFRSPDPWYPYWYDPYYGRRPWWW